MTCGLHGYTTRRLSQDSATDLKQKCDRLSRESPPFLNRLQRMLANFGDYWYEDLNTESFTVFTGRALSLLLCSVFGKPRTQ